MKSFLEKFIIVLFLCLVSVGVIAGGIYNPPVGGGSGGSTALSSLTSGTTTNTLDSTTNTQTWNWSTLGANTGLNLNGTTTGAGKVFSSTLTGAANTGYSGYFSNTATTGYALFANGRVSIPTYSNALGATVTGYTIQPSDMGLIVTTSNAASITTTVPQAGTAGYGYGTSFGYINNGSGSAVVNCPVALCNGSTSLSFSQNHGGLFYSDQNGNWDVFIAGVASGGSGTVNSGTAKQVAYYATTGAAVSGQSVLSISTTNVGINTTTPGFGLEVNSGSSTAGIQIDDTIGASFCLNATGTGGDAICFASSTVAGGLPHGFDIFDITQVKAMLGATTTGMQVTQGSSYLFATSTQFVGGATGGGISSPAAGTVDCDTSTVGNAGCTFQAATINQSGNKVIDTCGTGLSKSGSTCNFASSGTSTPLVGSGGTPTCGAGCSSITAGSTDLRGSMVSGSSVSSVALNFSATLAAAPFCVISDSNTTATADIASISTSVLTVNLASALTSVTIYWICAK